MKNTTSDARYYVEGGCVFHVVRPAGTVTITTGPHSLLITSMWKLPNWQTETPAEYTEISKASFDKAMLGAKKFVEDSLK